MSNSWSHRRHRIPRPQLCHPPPPPPPTTTDLLLEWIDKPYTTGAFTPANPEIVATSSTFPAETLTLRKLSGDAQWVIPAECTEGVPKETLFDTNVGSGDFPVTAEVEAPDGTKAQASTTMHVGI